jgi:hypothetical protein
MIDPIIQTLAFKNTLKNLGFGQAIVRRGFELFHLNAEKRAYSHPLWQNFAHPSGMNSFQKL